MGFTQMTDAKKIATTVVIVLVVMAVVARVPMLNTAVNGTAA